MTNPHIWGTLESLGPKEELRIGGGQCLGLEAEIEAVESGVLNVAPKQVLLRSLGNAMVPPCCAQQAMFKCCTMDHFHIIVLSIVQNTPHWARLNLYYITLRSRGISGAGAPITPYGVPLGTG